MVEKQTDQLSNCPRPNNACKLERCLQYAVFLFCRIAGIGEIEKNIVLPQGGKAARFSCPQQYRKEDRSRAKQEKPQAFSNVRKAFFPKETNQDRREKRRPDCNHIGPQQKDDGKAEPKQKDISQTITPALEKPKKNESRRSNPWQCIFLGKVAALPDFPSAYADSRQNCKKAGCPILCLQEAEPQHQVRCSQKIQHFQHPDAIGAVRGESKA